MPTMEGDEQSLWITTGSALCEVAVMQQRLSIAQLYVHQLPKGSLFAHLSTDLIVDM